MGGPEERGGHGRVSPRKDEGPPPPPPERGLAKESPEGAGWREAGAARPTGGTPKWGGGEKEAEEGQEGGRPSGLGAALGLRKLELKDAGTQVSWGPNQAGSPGSEPPGVGGARGEPKARARAPQGGSSAYRVRPGSGDFDRLLSVWGSERGPHRVTARREKGVSWPGEAGEALGSLGGRPRGEPKEVGTQLSRREAWELDLPRRVPRKGGQEGGARVPPGVSRSLSGGLPGQGAPKPPQTPGGRASAGLWVQEEWGRPPVEAPREVWVPRQPARAPSEKMGLPWLAGGPCPPQKPGGWEPGSRGVGGCPPALSQVWIPREKPEPEDVWVHKVRDPSGAGVMWVWAKVTNCSEEEEDDEEEEDARLWTFHKDGPRKGGQGAGGYGVS